MNNEVERYEGELRILRTRCARQDRELARLRELRLESLALVEHVVSECECGAVEHVKTGSE